mgnify:CR=1 FL=1
MFIRACNMSGAQAVLRRVREVVAVRGDHHAVSGREIERLAVEGHWQALARGTLREDAYSLQRKLCDQVLARGGRGDAVARVDAWLKSGGAEVDGLERTVREMRATGSTDFPTLSVALQAVRRLAGH